MEERSDQIWTTPLRGNSSQGNKDLKGPELAHWYPSKLTKSANFGGNLLVWGNEGDTLRIGDQTYEVAYVDPNNINSAQGIYVYGDASAWELGEDIYLLNVHETIIKVSGDASQ